jgi:hypothetical protein
MRSVRTRQAASLHRCPAFGGCAPITPCSSSVNSGVRPETRHDPRIRPPIANGGREPLDVAPDFRDRHAALLRGLFHSQHDQLQRRPTGGQQALHNADVLVVQLSPVEQLVLFTHWDHPQGAFEVVRVDRYLRVTPIDGQPDPALTDIGQCTGIVAARRDESPRLL